MQQNDSLADGYKRAEERCARAGVGPVLLGHELLGGGRALLAVGETVILLTPAPDLSIRTLRY